MRLALFALLALLAVALPSTAQAPEPRNVVVILADDLGWRDLGCQGSTFYETPSLDALARRGMRFRHAYAAGPVCSPTRASMLTGRYPARLHATDYFGGRRKGRLLPAPYDDRLSLDEVTLAEALREAGFATGFVGKWHLGGDGFLPEDQGFDINVGGFAAGHPPAGYFAPYRIPKLADGPDGEHLTDRLTTEALEFVTRHRDGPFLLYLSFYSVHTPLQAKPELVEKYRRKAAVLPASDRPEFAPEGERQARHVQNHAVYAAMVETLDHGVGRVLAHLDELGIAARTAVVFTSDNGGLSTSEGSPTSNVPLRAGKGWLYEGGIRVPLIVACPGVVAPGATCDVPVISTDLYPTCLALAGQPARPAQHRDGTSLMPLLTGASEPPGERPLFWHYPHYGNQGGFPGGAVRLGRHKLIERFETGRVELYDLAADPGERSDLAAALPEVATALATRLRAWRATVDARMPSPNPEFGAAGR